MAEGLSFYVLAIIATLSAVAIILLRSPLQSILASIVNIICIALLFVLLRAPLIAIVQFAIVVLLFLGTIQLIRNLGPDVLRTRRRFSFGQTIGLIVSFFLGVSVLLHLTSTTSRSPISPRAGIVPDQTLLAGLTEGDLIGLAVAAFVLLVAIIGFRFITRCTIQDSIK